MSDLDRWHCWKMEIHRVKDSTGEIISRTDEYMGLLHEPKDCLGCDLYDFMTNAGWIETMDDFNCDAEETYVAVMHKGDDLDFIWEYGRRLFTYKGIPGNIMSGDDEIEFLRMKDKDYMVDFEPVFSHESYEDSFPLCLSDLVDVHRASDEVAGHIFQMYLEDHATSCAMDEANET